MSPDGLTLPRFQNWSLTFERRLTKNMMLDVSYIGNKGSRLNHHAQRAGLDYNMNDPASSALGAALLNSNINSPAARQANIRIPYPGFNGTVAQALRRYPQYQNIEWRGLPLGRSQYHALEVVLEQQLSRGLQYRIGYTFSRLKNNGAESGQGNEGINGEVQDPVNWDTPDYGLSADDCPHVLLAAFTWDIASGSSLDGGQEGPPRRLEPQRDPALRERPAAAHRHGQRHGRPALQHREAPEPHRHRWPWRTTAISIHSPTTTSTGPAGRTRVPSRSATRPGPTGRCAGSRCSTKT